MRGWIGPMARRLHFYAGLFIGPFILVAALSGATYAVSPAIEEAVYEHELSAPAYTAGSTARPLAEQLTVAEEAIGPDADYSLSAVRPAPEPGATTRVMYGHPDLEASETRAVFVDPVSLEVRGVETVYGTSGALPLRTALSQFHRHLGLGEPGRLYSELAASWLWVVALGGFALWLLGRRGRAARRVTTTALRGPGTGRRRLARWHGSVGVWVLVGALFLSATGLTWSAHAGANVTSLRSALGWTTPSVSTELEPVPATASTSSGAAASGGGMNMSAGAAEEGATFDAVWAAARAENIDTDLVEIKPAADPASAWTVTEIQRNYPTKVDSVAVDPATLATVDRVDFADFPLPAKLARWGADLHMGQLFGVANQVVLATLGLAFAALVVLGYTMWIRRGTRAAGKAPSGGALARAPWWGLALAFGLAAGIGLFLPLFGLSLAAFVVLDGVAAAVAGRRQLR